jgi:hypothetical protein
MNEEVEKDKALLRKEGYFVDTLYSIEHVQMNFDCTDEEAHTVLEKVFTNEYTTDTINDTIKIIANSLNLKPKE